MLTSGLLQSDHIIVREKVGEALTDKPNRRSEIKVSALVRASTLLVYRQL